MYLELFSELCRARGRFLLLWMHGYDFWVSFLNSSKVGLSVGQQQRLEFDWSLQNAGSEVDS